MEYLWLKVKQLTVLYVEDKLDIKVKKLYTVANGIEGLESYKVNQFDIIITDIQMLSWMV